MKEPPKFIQICSSNKKEYLFFAISEDGEIFAYSEAYSSSGLGHVPACWRKMVGEIK